MPKPQKEHDIVVPQELIKELLTPSEWRMVKQRLKILYLLERGLTIRKIAEEVGVGTDTVTRMARKLELSEALRSNFRQFSIHTKQSKWIFGKIHYEEK